jgi:hypothetical protein
MELELSKYQRNPSLQERKTIPMSFFDCCSPGKKSVVVPKTDSRPVLTSM